MINLSRSTSMSCSVSTMRAACPPDEQRDREDADRAAQQRAHRHARSGPARAAFLYLRRGLPPSQKRDATVTVHAARAPPARQRRRRAYLRGLLPDNENVLRRWGSRFSVPWNSPFAHLRNVGQDVAGAAQFVRESRVVEATAPGATVPEDETYIPTVCGYFAATVPPGTTPTLPASSVSPGHRPSSRYTAARTGSGACRPAAARPPTSSNRRWSIWLIRSQRAPLPAHRRTPRHARRTL